MASNSFMSPTVESELFVRLSADHILPSRQHEDMKGMGVFTPVRTESQISASTAQERFTRTMLEFCSRSEDPELKDFNIRIVKGGWPAVLATSTEAREVYDSKRKGFVGFFKRADISIAHSNSVVDPLLEMLPCGEYTSVVCGGIKLIFAAFKRKADTEKCVMGAIGSAPFYLEQAENFLRLYSQDQALQDLASELFIALLDAVEASVAWLSQSSTRLREMWIKPGNIQAKRDIVDAVAQRLNERATICDRQENILSREMTQEVLIRMMYLCREHSKSIDQVSRVAQASEELKLAFVTAQKRWKDWNNHLDDMSSQQRLALADSQVIAQKMSSDLSHMKHLLAKQLASAQQRSDQAFQLADQERRKNERLHDVNQRLQDVNERLNGEKDRLCDSKNAEIRRLEVENLELRRQKSDQSIMVVLEVINPSQMITWLGNLGGASKFDASCYAGRGQIVDLGRLLSTKITSSPQFSSWVATPQSAMLLIDVAGSTAKYPKVSPGSYVAATIARAINEQSSYALVLQHFCAQHQFKIMDFDQVSDILASLICQLLEAFPFELAMWTNSNPWGYNWVLHCQLAPERQLQYLCRLLEHLITSLRYNVAYIFLDDLYLLERSAEDESLQMMYECFRRIMARSSALKVLFITPDSNKSHPGYVYRKADTREILRITLGDVERQGADARRTNRYHGDDAPLSTFV